MKLFGYDIYASVLAIIKRSIQSMFVCTLGWGPNSNSHILPATYRPAKKKITTTGQIMPEPSVLELYTSSKRKPRRESYIFVDLLLCST
jgi:hypothetical protein